MRAGRDRACCSCAGPSIFGGYLNYDGESPFFEWDGKRWYRTGDLVRQDADGWLYFEGRLKRFVKLGGEMISLPAIEAVLLPHFSHRGRRRAAARGRDDGVVRDARRSCCSRVRPTDRETR